MRRCDLLAGLGLVLVSGPALAQDVLGLTCRDALEELGRPSPDTYDLAAAGRAVQLAFKDQDAARGADGKTPIAERWIADGMTAEVMAVLLSCRAHASDTLAKRAMAQYRAALPD